MIPSETLEVRPLVGTASHPFVHLGYMQSGHLHGAMSDGGTLDLRAGDVFSVPPRHDAWVVGDKPHA